jgi:PHD/YefM family antitoxin component YafN of YafNO toxin-antitoxin module
METITVTIDQAQRNWQHTMEVASAATHEVVIEQQGKPIATLVNDELFQHRKRALRILEGLKRAEANRQERLADSSTITLSELTEKLSLAGRKLPL